MIQLSSNWYLIPVSSLNFMNSVLEYYFVIECHFMPVLLGLIKVFCYQRTMLINLVDTEQFRHSQFHFLIRFGKHLLISFEASVWNSLEKLLMI